MLRAHRRDEDDIELTACRTRWPGELLEFPNEHTASPSTSNRTRFAPVILGDYGHLHEGDEVRTTGRLLEVPVGDELIGVGGQSRRAPAGRQGADRQDHQDHAIEKDRPGAHQHASAWTARCNRHLKVDIGRHDPDRDEARASRSSATGSPARPRSCWTRSSTRRKDLICVYVAIGQNAASIARATATLNKNGDLDYTIIVAATASDAASLKLHRSVCGLRDGEYFMEQARKPCAATTTSPSRRGLIANSRSTCAARRPRGLSGRLRVLPALENRRASGEDESGQRWRVPDGAAGDIEYAGGLRLGIHPDQRDLDQHQIYLQADRCQWPAAGAQRVCSVSACRWATPRRR